MNWRVLELETIAFLLVIGLIFTVGCVAPQTDEPIEPEVMETGSLKIIVLDDEGAPLIEAEVILALEELEFLLQTDTNGEAYFEDLPVGNYDVFISAPGFESMGGQVMVLKFIDAENVFQLEKIIITHGLLTVNVTDEGQAVENATVKVMDVNGLTLEVEQTDDEGQVSLVLEQGDYALEVEALDYYLETGSAVIVAEDEARVSIEMEGVVETFLQVRVESVTTMLLTDVRIDIYDANKETILATYYTEKGGIKKITDLRPGTYQVKLSKENYADLWRGPYVMEEGIDKGVMAIMAYQKSS